MSEAAAAGPADLMVKVVMCGDSAVGKSNLLGRFTRNTFLDDSKSTIGAEFATRTVEMECTDPRTGEKSMRKIKMQIWDTAGQERYRSITRTYYRDALGCLLVYSVGSRKSFEHLDRWLDEIRQNANKDPVVALVGNKCDLAKRKIQSAEAASFAKAQRLLPHETSAKTGDGVEEAFISIVRALLQQRPELFDSMPKIGAKAQPAAAAAPGAGGAVRLDAANVQPEKKDGKKGCC